MSRSTRRISDADLRRLAAVARADRENLFRRKPDLARLYRHRVLCVALCQGAALHFLDGRNGVNDFGVWTFFEQGWGRPFPPRRNQPRDFGSPKFGKSPDRSDFVGRRVDCFGRSIRRERGQETFDAVRVWLGTSRNPSPRLLARKPAIVLEPPAARGQVLWQPDDAG